MPELRTALLTGALLLAGCSLLQPDTDPVTALDDALAAQDYNTAWAIANRVDPEEASDALTQRLETLNQDIIRFERTRITQARQFANQGRWAEALTHLDDARRHWAHGYAIAEARSELDQRQMVDLLRERTQLLVREAEWLQSTESAVEGLTRFADPSATSLQQRYRQQSASLAEELTTLGEWHASQEHWSLARDALRSAARLEPARADHPQRARAEQEVANANRAAQARRTSTLQREARNRLERYQRSGTIEDLLAARDYIEQHRHRGNLQREATEVETLVGQRFREDLATGDALYASGDYQAAYRQWSRIAPLRPGDQELDKKLERTRRVLGSLEQLRNQ
ncbi:hypothetical protein [Isoalcanivorax indicus]|uniref:hypothetical protein n=1 Tax=Isoalcanivorax indicus TaxID=2202653 RepID=UPI000DB96B0F|nr:hypothetical protein [Isoalcanivorax indicus]